jgi:DNA-binding transcriptional ArsR family regulator
VVGDPAAAQPALAPRPMGFSEIELSAAFGALSDASRRQMIRLLLQKPRRAGELAECLDMSPQALSRHLRVLRKAGLVFEHGIERDARVRIYSVHATAFPPVQDWMAQVENLWRRQLQAFKDFAENPRRTGRLKA